VKTVTSGEAEEQNGDQICLDTLHSTRHLFFREVEIVAQQD
jgi:hypothetical protein